MMKYVKITFVATLAALATVQTTFAQSTTSRSNVATNASQRELERTAALIEDSKSSKDKKDIMLQTGKVLKNAYVLDKRPNGLSVAHDDGVMFIHFSDMPLEMQKKYNYNPIKAAAYERDLQKSRKAAEKAEMDRKADQEEAVRKAAARMKDQAIFKKRQRIKELELQIDELKRKTSAMDRNIERNQSERFHLATTGTGSVRVATPFGFGRIGGHNNVSTVLNETRRETENLQMRRDNAAQDLIDLQLRLESEKHELGVMMDNADSLF